MLTKLIDEESSFSIWKSFSQLGMPIPRQFSFLGDSGNWGLHFFIPRGFGDLEPILRGPGGIFGELNPLKLAILSNEYDTQGLNFIKYNDQN